MKRHSATTLEFNNQIELLAEEKMTIRRATAADLQRMVELSDAKRTEYER